jgi:hypothetical protein
MDFLQLLRWCRVSTCERPRNNARQILLETVQRDVAHLYLETLGACVVCLAEGDIAAQRGLDCKARMIPDVVVDESFELFVNDTPDLQRNALIGPVVQLGASIIRIEGIDAATVYGNAADLPLPGGPAITIIWGRISCRSRVSLRDACRPAIRG